MIRFLTIGLLLTALFLAGGRAWAGEPPAGDAAAGAEAKPGQGPQDIPAGRVSDPPVPAVTSPPLPTMAPEQGGALLGETLLQDGASAAAVQRALRPGAYPAAASPWQGQVRFRWRYRTTTEERQEGDNDLYGYLKLKYRDENLPGWSASFHGRATLALGNFGETSEYWAFNSIIDTYPHRLNGRLYHAYANYRWASGFFEEVRIGRQYNDVGEYLLFDGVRATTRARGAARWQFSAFAGTPSYLFDSSPDDGRVTAGGSVSAKLAQRTDVRLDYTYVRNDNRYFGQVGDHLWNLNVNQRIGMNTLIRGTYQHLNDDPRLLRILFDTLVPNSDITVRGYFHSLLSYARESVYDFDYFYAVQLTLEPYWMGNLSVSKGIGEFFVLEGGVNLRQLYDAGDEGRYNRNFEQYYGSVSTDDWLVRDLRLSLAGEYWNGDDDIWTVTFDADWRPSPCWRFRVGTDYSAYRYDMYADAERENVYGGFLRASWEPSASWRFDLRLRVDDDDYGTWTTLDAGVAFNF